MFQMTIEDVFTIRGRGTVATGRVEAGQLRVGDEVRVNGSLPLVVSGIEAFRKRLSEANPGDTIGVLFAKVERGQLNRGDVLTAPFLV
jgi:translation elongation factor EF-Tu-like GTPase